MTLTVRARARVCLESVEVLQTQFAIAAVFSRAATAAGVNAESRTLHPTEAPTARRQLLFQGTSRNSS